MNRLRQRLQAGSTSERRAGSGHREECSEEGGLRPCQTSEECLLLVAGSDEAMSHAANAPDCSLAGLGLNDTKQAMDSCAMVQCSSLPCYSKTNMLHEPSFGKWISVFFRN